jgi:hypothetical protein
MLSVVAPYLQLLFAGKASNFRIELQTVLNLYKLQSCSQILNWCHDTQHNDTQYKDNQQNDTQHKVHMTPSINDITAQVPLR